MSYLFVTENNIAKPNTETILISPFKEIWERDNTSTKERATKEFTYIELMSSKKKTNPYAGYSDEQRHNKLAEQIFNDLSWKPDELVEQGLATINQLQKEASPTYSYYLSACKAAEKLKTFFETFDINEVNEKGARVFKPNDIVNAVANTDKLLQNLNSMKEKVEKELFETVKTRGDQTINPFEM